MKFQKKRIHKGFNDVRIFSEIFINVCMKLSDRLVAIVLTNN